MRSLPYSPASISAADPASHQQRAPKHPYVLSSCHSPSTAKPTALPSSSKRLPSHTGLFKRRKIAPQCAVVVKLSVRMLSQQTTTNRPQNIGLKAGARSLRGFRDAPCSRQTPGGRCVWWIILGEHHNDLSPTYDTHAVDVGFRCSVFRCALPTTLDFFTAMLARSSFQDRRFITGGLDVCPADLVHGLVRHSTQSTTHPGVVLQTLFGIPEA